LTSDNEDNAPVEQPDQKPKQDEITDEKEEEEIQSPVFEPIEYGKSKVFFEEWHSRQTIKGMHLSNYSFYDSSRKNTSKNFEGCKKSSFGMRRLLLEQIRNRFQSTICFF
jgi:cytochrome c biogenesis protein ResB